MKTFIIAEAGVNHNGSIKLAKKMVDVAKKAGADAVKFQAYESGMLTSRFAPKARYQREVTGSAQTQLQMLKSLELDKYAQRILIDYCRMRKIQFLSTPFDLGSIGILVNLGIKVFKIPSGEITNLPYLRKIGSLKKRVIMSTGMSTLAEVKRALKVLMESGTARKNISLLHCNTAYPTPFEDANINAMVTMKKSLRLNVGYSDHTRGIEASIAAVALGATIIEKHFTLDRSMQGPDHKASLEPFELKHLVNAIRNVEKAMGGGTKNPSSSEIENIPVARKSIVALRGIAKGESFTKRNITTKRPGSGISPMRWDAIIGRLAKKAFKEDELIEI